MITVKELREQKNLSQKDIAEILKLSVTGYAGKESGYRKFKSHEAISLADYFNVDIREISDFLSNNTRKANYYIGKAGIS